MCSAALLWPPEPSGSERYIVATSVQMLLPLQSEEKETKVGMLERYTGGRHASESTARKCIMHGMLYLILDCMNGRDLYELCIL